MRRSDKRLSYKQTREYTCQICPDVFGECIVSNNRSLLREADALLFHYRDMNWADLPSVSLFATREALLKRPIR